MKALVVLFAVCASLPFAEKTQAQDIQEFGAFPQGAIVYGRLTRPGRGIEETQTLLRDSGHFGLAAGIEDLFYRERTESVATMNSFGDTLGMLLNPSSAPWVISMLGAVEDWGRGNRPETTRRALRALEIGEFAVYPGGKSLQLLRGDIQSWRAALAERGPVRDLPGEGAVAIQEIDMGPRARFTAIVGSGVALRSNDEIFLRRAIALVRTANPQGTLRSSALFRDCFQEEDEDARSVTAVDAGALIEEMRASGQISPTLDPWVRALLRGARGLRYTVDPLRLRFEFFASADCPLLLSFGSGISLPAGPGGPGDRSLGEVGLRLDWRRLIEALAAEPESAGENTGSVTPRSLARLLANFDGRTGRLWIPEGNRAVLALASKDRELLVAAWKWVMGLASFVPGQRAQFSREKDWERIAWTGAEEDEGDKPIVLTRFDRWLLLSDDPASADLLMERLRDDPAFFDASRFAGSLTRVQGKELIADLEPPFNFWNGDVIAQVPFGSGSHPATWLRLDLGVRPDSWKRTQQLWEALRTQRPQWHESLGTVLFRDFEPARNVGDFSLRWGPGKQRAAAASNDRIRLEWKFDWVKDLLDSVRTKGSAEDSFPATLEASMRQKIKASRSPAEAALFELRMDFEPIFEEVARSGSLFRGFLRRAAGEWGWPWLSLRTKQRVRAAASEGGMRLVFDLNREPGLLSVLSTFFDRYRPSAFEERTMARVLAVEQAQRVFQTSKAQDRNGNGVGEFAALAELRDASKTGVPAEIFLSGNPSNSLEWAAEGYRFRLLLPRDVEEQERRWCLFAFPEIVGPEHHMVFYVDERGFLMTAWQVMPEQMELPNRETFSSLSAAFSAVSFGKPALFWEFCMKPEFPPEHREVYEYFLPYLPVYGRRLQGR